MPNPIVDSVNFQLKDRGAPPWGSVGSSIESTPLLSEDFSGGVDGDQLGLPWLNTYYDDSMSVSGGQSARVNLQLGQPPGICGGGNSYGARLTLQESVPVGKRLWLAMRIYEPSTLTGGYVYGTSDGTEAATCGKNADGSGFLKGLVTAPDIGTARNYVLTKLGRRDVTRVPDGRLTSESNGSIFSGVTFPVVSDQWYVQQMEIFVSDDDGVGYIRYWRDDVFVGEVLVKTVASAVTSISEAGIGDYWNGVPYTDGAASRDDFWIDKVVVYSDIDGFGAPSGLDSGGRTYIDPVTEL